MPSYICSLAKVRVNHQTNVHNNTNLQTNVNTNTTTQRLSIYNESFWWSSYKASFSWTWTPTDPQGCTRGMKKRNCFAKVIVRWPENSGWERTVDEKKCNLEIDAVQADSHGLLGEPSNASTCFVHPCATTYFHWLNAYWRQITGIGCLVLFFIHSNNLTSQLVKVRSTKRECSHMHQITFVSIGRKCAIQTPISAI